jgi:hypothetical protein
MPYMMKRWRRKSVPEAVPIYTRARPGRQLGSRAAVPDSEVMRWLDELPKHRPLSIISLLGRKPDGMDEHAFYSFRDASGFRTWLESKLEPPIHLLTHPTIDFNLVSQETIGAINTDLERELSLGRTVVIVDSGGVQRTGQICRSLQLVEDPRKLDREP